MAQEPGIIMRPIYQRVLKTHCDRSLAHGQATLARELQMTRKTLNRALNGKPVAAEYLERIEGYARQLIADDPDVVEKVYQSHERELLPEFKMAKIIEGATHFPRERCQHLAREIWRGIRADL